MALPIVSACDIAIAQFTPSVRMTIRYLARQREALKEYASICKQYVDVCLSSQSLTFEPTFSETDRTQVLSRLILLVNDDGEPFCHGFKLGSFVVTAAHCAKTPQIEVRGVSSPVRSYYNVVRKGAQNDGTFGSEDFALLRNRDPSVATTAEDIAWLGQPLQNKRILIAQVNAYRLIANDQQTAQDFSALVSFEDNPTCKASGISNGYILNACQSVEGSSGTPYFQRDTGGRLRLVGIHAGETASIRDTSLSECGTSLANYGVIIPYDIIAAEMNEASLPTP